MVATVTHLPDHRSGPQRLYEIADAALGELAVFFTQSPSFLAYQRDLQRRKGRNNAQSLFGIRPSGQVSRCAAAYLASAGNVLRQQWRQRWRWCLVTGAQP